MHFHHGDANIALGHGVETIRHFCHPRIRPESPASRKLNLIRIVFGLLRRKVLDAAERFTMLFDLVDQFRRKVMMVNIDGAGGPAGGSSRRLHRGLCTAGEERC